MIYVTVGTQLQFDRLIRAVDCWAERVKRIDVFAQIGKSTYLPQAISWERFLSPAESIECVRAADVVVSHAGMGTIIEALEYGTPIIVFPRLAALGEQRSDHQLSTARHFGKRGLVDVAEDETALSCILDGLNGSKHRACLTPFASAELTGFLAEFLGKP